MIRILNIEPLGYSPVARQILERAGELTEKAVTRSELLRMLPDYDVLIVRLGHQIDQEILSAGTRLRAIVSATTGLDHIDTEYAKNQDIAVLSLQGEREFLKTIHATAEHTWALLLALLRHIPAAHDAVLRGEWDRDRFRGHELGGKDLSLVGLGRLGKMVAGYGLAFGMNVRAFDPHAEDTSDDIAMVGSLADLLEHADVLSIHVPLNKTTTALIGGEELALLPPQAVLINTSRGEIVDEMALLAALTANRLAGAALDVVVGERSTSGRANALIEYAAGHENLILTPHISGATHESMEKTEIFMAKKVVGFLDGVTAHPSRVNQ
jgi:D-3-phosphoglycerate dehydrogenase